ncbi:FtsK/SpoIIIE domain-containing protein [Bacillus mesophilum]|uniref:Cell division protein FtsK n=1 Tax=Bacillus mesophilum TaxID=1071718 RepID=A0A7V7UVM3_9BACI|nr:FtsK/SpoIIIE domain-containing protein [Bacillus mesophilum]KAB2332916.1 cell division protein FtsK [Bacillus mesophilum]
MLFELLSSALVGGLVGASYFHQIGLGGNDTQNITRIAANAGLVAKDGTQIRPFRRTNKGDYVEYVFQLPQGLSAQQFRDKLDRFQDGLNAKRRVRDISLADLRAINWRSKDVVTQLRKLAKKKKTERKEVEIEFDGMLKFRVYTEALTEFYEVDESLFMSLKGWEVPAGMSRQGLIKHDFDKIAHSLIGGSTDFGKSNILKLWITALIHRRPNDVKFTLIDLKGGLSFSRFRKAKQVEIVAKNPDEALLALTAVQERMNKTMDYLEANGFEDVKEAGIKERYFTFIDEAADIADDADCVEIIIDIARRGRAAGERLIYATQYPTAQTIDSQIKRNCIGRICFVLDTGVASKVVIDQEGAEKLPLVKGRAIYKQVKCTELQTPYISNNTIDRIITPHITFKARKEDDEHVSDNSKGATPGTHTLDIEEIGIS